MWLYYGKGGLLRVRKVLQRRHACEDIRQVVLPHACQNARHDKCLPVSVFDMIRLLWFMHPISLVWAWGRYVTSSEYFLSGH